MESLPLAADICSSDYEIGRQSSVNWFSDLVGERIGSDGLVVVGELPSWSPTKQKRSLSDDEFICYSLNAKQSSMQKSASILDEDCVILDGDPDKPAVIVGKSGDGSDDLAVISEKGPVACRDFPHPRHLCVNFPFKASPREQHCDLCHCYVCDTRAPCAYWGTGVSPGDHCHSSDSEEKWRTQRKAFRIAQLPSATSIKSVKTTVSMVSTACEFGSPLSPSPRATMNSVPLQSPVSRINRHSSWPPSNFVGHPPGIISHKRYNQSPSNRLSQLRRNTKDLPLKVPCTARSWQQKQQNSYSSRFAPTVTTSAATTTQAVNCRRNYGPTVTSMSQRNHKPSLSPSEDFHLSRIKDFLLGDDDLNADDLHSLCLSDGSTDGWETLYNSCKNVNASNQSLAPLPTFTCPLSASATASLGSSAASQFQSNMQVAMSQTPSVSTMVDPPGSGSCCDAAPLASLSVAPDLLNIDLLEAVDATVSDSCSPKTTRGSFVCPIETWPFQSQLANRDLVVAELGYVLPESLSDPADIGLIQEAYGN